MTTIHRCHLSNSHQMENTYWPPHLTTHWNCGTTRRGNAWKPTLAIEMKNTAYSPIFQSPAERYSFIKQQFQIDFHLLNKSFVLFVIFSGSCRVAKTTWFTFGICRARKWCNAYKAIQMLSFAPLAIRQKISLRRPPSKMTRQSNCGKAIHKLTIIIIHLWFFFIFKHFRCKWPFFGLFFTFQD